MVPSCQRLAPNRPGTLNVPHTVALRSLRRAIRELGRGNVWTADLRLRQFFSAIVPPKTRTLVRGANQARSAAFAAVASLLGIGLLNALTYAKAARTWR